MPYELEYYAPAQPMVFLLISRTKTERSYKRMETWFSMAAECLILGSIFPLSDQKNINT